MGFEGQLIQWYQNNICTMNINEDNMQMSLITTIGMHIHHGDISASFSRIAQGCQGGTRLIMDLDGLIYQKMQ